MTEQEAIANLKSIQKEYEKKKFGVEALKLGIKALEKQIAKKPTDIDEDSNTFKCPSCGHTLIALDDMTIHKHCLICGQKLDWGNEDAG